MFPLFRVHEQLHVAVRSTWTQRHVEACASLTHATLGTGVSTVLVDAVVARRAGVTGTSLSVVHVRAWEKGENGECNNHWFWHSQSAKSGIYLCAIFKNLPSSVSTRHDYKDPQFWQSLSKIIELLMCRFQQTVSLPLSLQERIWQYYNDSKFWQSLRKCGATKVQCLANNLPSSTSTRKNMMRLRQSIILSWTALLVQSAC